MDWACKRWREPCRAEMKVQSNHPFSTSCLNHTRPSIPIPSFSKSIISPYMYQRDLMKNSTIEAYYPPVTPKTLPLKSKHSDGFDGYSAPVTPQSPWTPKQGISYVPMKIRDITTGPGRITFTGRIVNFREMEHTSKSATAAKALLKMTVTDETGAIEVSSSHLFYHRCLG